MRSNAKYAALGLLVGWLSLSALASQAPEAVTATSAPAHPVTPASARTTQLRALRDGQRVDLNAATSADLELLPGIGPRLAQRIVAARTARGGFNDVADLAAISGIGPAKLEALARLACAGAACKERAAQRSNAHTNDSAPTR